MDSIRSPHTCHGVNLESIWSLSGVYQESIHFIRSPSGCVGECHLQSMGVSPDLLWAALENPKHMMELMRGLSHKPSKDKVMSQINEACAQLETKARLPPEKLRLSQHDELEAENREVEKQMIRSACDGTVLQTFVGQNQSFSTTPIEQLEKSAFYEQVIVFVLILHYKFLCKTCLHIKSIQCVFTMLSQQNISLNNVALGTISCLLDHIQSR
jgi:hypothetical protein